MSKFIVMLIRVMLVPGALYGRTGRSGLPARRAAGAAPGPRSGSVQCPAPGLTPAPCPLMLTPVCPQVRAGVRGRAQQDRDLRGGAVPRLDTVGGLDTGQC